MFRPMKNLWRTHWNSRFQEKIYPDSTVYNKFYKCVLLWVSFQLSLQTRRLTKCKGIISAITPVKICFIEGPSRWQVLPIIRNIIRAGFVEKKRKEERRHEWRKRGISGSTEERRIVRQNRIMERGRLTERSLIKPINRMSRNMSVGEFHGLERTVFKPAAPPRDIFPISAAHNEPQQRATWEIEHFIGISISSFLL